MNIAATVKSDKQIDKIRYASQVLADLLESLTDFIQPGVSLLEIDAHVEETIRSRGGLPAFKGFNGFPNAACISVNDCVIHGIPSHRKLKEGDIVGVDIGMNYQGGFGDTAYTYGVGTIKPEVVQLLQIAEKSLYTGIEKALANNRVGDISHAVQSLIHPYGYGIVRQYCGHGVGNDIWEPPEIPNYGNPGRGIRLRKNMVIAIEPMVNLGTKDIYIDGDGWSVLTSDHKYSAHFEHTVLVTDGKPEILTLWKSHAKEHHGS